MLPLRLLLTPYDALSLGERARAILLAREAGTFCSRLLGAAGRPSAILAWQRLVIEEALLRGIISTDEAVALMRHTLLGERGDPRLEGFLQAWAEEGGGAPAHSPGGRRLRVLRGGQAGQRPSRALIDPNDGAPEASNGTPVRRS